jgi:hypothetical protein
MTDRSYLRRAILEATIIVVVALLLGLIAVLAVRAYEAGDRTACERRGGVWLSRDAVCVDPR